MVFTSKAEQTRDFPMFANKTTNRKLCVWPFGHHWSGNRRTCMEGRGVGKWGQRKEQRSELSPSSSKVRGKSETHGDVLNYFITSGPWPNPSSLDTDPPSLLTPCLCTTRPGGVAKGGNCISTQRAPETVRRRLVFDAIRKALESISPRWLSCLAWKAGLILRSPTAFPLLLLRNLFQPFPKIEKTSLLLFILRSTLFSVGLIPNKLASPKKQTSSKKNDNLNAAVINIFI